VSWFKVDDKLHAHPKVTAAGLRAMGLWVVSGSWSASYERDGHVTTEFVRLHAPPSVAQQLVEAGLWLPAEGGWQFHDWPRFQPTREQLDEQRARDAERQRNYRLSQRDNGTSHSARGAT
jgi:hypothetical protein